MDLLRTKAASKFNDDELYIAVGHLLKLGVDVSPACKAEPSNTRLESTSSSSGTAGEPDAPIEGAAAGGTCSTAAAADVMGVHEVAWLAQRVACRTLAMLIKGRPATAARVNEYPTLRAGVRSNKEYTLLNLVARGADFNPYLGPLTLEAVRYCCHKALPWLLQWQDVTPAHMMALLQSALPDPLNASCADVAAMLEVLLTHGLDPQASVTSPSGLTQPLLVWGVEFAVAALTQGAAAGATVAARASSNGGGAAAVSDSCRDHSRTASAGGGAGQTGDGLPSDQRYGAVELVQVLLKCGAGDAKSKADALLLAAHGLRPELVTELVKAGADPSGAGVDLLKWAVDGKQCPPSSGVLEALLHNHRAEQEAQRQKEERAARMAAAAAKRGVGRAAGSVGVVARAPGISTTAPEDDGARGTLPSCATTAGPARLAPIIAAAPTPPTSSPVRGSASKLNGGGTLATPSARIASPTTLTPARPAAPDTAGTAATTAAASASSSVGGAVDNGPSSEASFPAAAATTGAAAGAWAGAAAASLAVAGAVSPGSQQDAVAAAGPPAKQPPKSLLPVALLRELHRDSALVEAVGRNDLHAVQCLLDAGADVHHKQDKALLLAMGAIDPDMPDKWMPRPRDRAAVLSMSRPIVELLLARGANVNARDGRAVVQAARWKDTYSLRYLESLGADMSVLQSEPALARLWPPKERSS